MGERVVPQPVSSNRKEDVLSKMDPEVIHRVLLTDKAQFRSLTVSGKPTATTPSFDAFCQDIEDSKSQNVGSTVNRAYRDHICTFVLQTRNMEPLHKLLLDLHAMIRSLVPNRKDLHGILNDEKVVSATTPSEMLPLVLEAARALKELESEVRSKSTQEWIKIAEEFNASSDAKETISFLVESIMYLLYKVELCQADKQDFFLANVWAPEIHARGKELEKNAFERRYGSLSDESTVPLTRAWIKALVEKKSSQEKAVIRDSSQARTELIKEGWVEDIIFRGANKDSLALPEVLSLDNANIREIRNVTKIAAAGCALALHACNAAGKSPTVLNQPFEQTSLLEVRRGSIVQAMAGRNVPSQEEYEEAVATAVFALAREWNPTLGDATRENLQNRTCCVLRGEDAVMKLLDSRMKEAFRYLILWKPQHVPLELRSGRGGAKGGQGGTEASKLFETQAMKEFCKRGLSFYASDLTSACRLAIKVIDLAWDTYGKDLLDRMILDACGVCTKEQ